MKKTISSIYVIIGGMLWGSMGIFVRGLANCGLSSLEICLVRVVTSTVMLAVLLGIFNRKTLHIKLKDLWCFIGTGVMSLTFFGYCYFTAIQMTSMAVAAVLLYTSPVFVLLMSAVLFKEKITGRKVFCIILAITGCALVTGLVGSGLNLPIMGLLFGLGSGFGYALYSIFGRFALNKGYGPMTVTFYSFFFSSLALLFLVNPVAIIGKVLQNSSVVNNSIQNGVMSTTYSSWMYIIGLAIFATILPYLFYTSGLAGIDNSKAAVLACIEPITATVLGFLVFAEMLSGVEIVGIVMVMVSIVLMG